MAVDGKLLVEIERMFHLVGILQEQRLAMNKQLMTLTSGISSSAECIEDLDEKESTAVLEMITKEVEETKQEEEKVKLESTNQELASVEYKQGDLWISFTTNLRKMQKMKKEDPGAYGIQELKIKKYEGGLQFDFDFEDADFVEIFQQLLSNILVRRENGWMVTEFFRDSRADIKDYQQDRRRGTERDLKASDVRNPG